MSASSKSKYQLNKDGKFVIGNYNSAKPFSSFFPGIAGKMGIPMWVFYVNRGQCICSMGIQDKEHPIMEFLPANWAYQLVSSQGFRTFLKFPQGSGINFYEPFQNHYRDREIIRTQSMHISPSGLHLVEENETLGLRFTVEYYSIPEDNFPGLIRKLHITNLNNIDISFEGLDGLPLIIPYGLTNAGLKHVRRLMEAFVEVKNLEEKAPLFKAKVKPADRPDVEILEKGNFYLGFEHDSDGTNLLNPIVDPELIFGTQNNYSFPEKFLDESIQDILGHQAIENRLPSAMSLFKKQLGAGQTYTVTSIIGHVDSREELNSLIPSITKMDYINSKVQSSITIIDELTQKNLVISSNPTFDKYVRQNFLDNVLRGGFPYTLKGESSKSVLHLYSRKHGDLERDYNDYRITPSFYSQGNGNFRDVNQNRRSDLFFNPDVKSGNLEHFVNLIQLDGFNPLVIKEIKYTLEDNARGKNILIHHLPEAAAEQALVFLQKEVTPGELLAYLDDLGVNFPGNADSFLGDLLPCCKKIHDTDFAEGYWSDHWTYNMDLLENYLSIYPDNLKYIVWDYQKFTFHDTAHRVLPRDDKYVIWENKKMQLNGLELVEEKAALMATRAHDRDLVRTRYGHGEVVQTTLFIKLISTITNKIASLDPSGIGVEMETDKPNWYDALNGIPGLMGSSLSETLEIKRHAAFLLNFLQESTLLDDEVDVFEELAAFMQKVFELLPSTTKPFDYWDAATSAKEAYREQTLYGISGQIGPVKLSWITEFLTACVTRIDDGVARAWNSDGTIPYTYFTHRPKDYELIETISEDGRKAIKTNSKGLSCFRVKSFECIHLPLFLEGPVHYLRCRPDQQHADQVTTHIRKSGLFDQKLKMYKVNESLKDQPMEIGRARTFSPGWFENESIWLHMEYKYMLEVLRNGLYDTFFADFKQVFIPFLDPEVYGRSILENSSFIVSSANPNPGLHGTGFVARLSGATAEFIHILMEMAVGPNPFAMKNEKDLMFNLKPVLPSWLFTDQAQNINLTNDGNTQSMVIPANSFSFMFLGDMLISYINPGMKNTYGPDSVSPMEWTLYDDDGGIQHMSGSTLEGNTAKMIRSKKIRRIEIVLK
ncbi:MAG: hypothetical protein K9N29_00655 [Candidatus Marinimicrobia bacterium]|nr:hypothetical protein [Candidatus Neomarinimicrobiota bacterium]